MGNSTLTLQQVQCKKIFIAAFMGMAVMGLGIGITLGMEAIKKTPQASAQIQKKVVAKSESYSLQPAIQQATGEVQKAIQIIGREQYTSAEWADLKNKISADSEKKLFVASNGISITGGARESKLVGTIF